MTALNTTEAQKTAVPATEQATAAAWKTWIASQHTTGNGAVPDYANPEQMNRYLVPGPRVDGALPG